MTQSFLAGDMTAVFLAKGNKTPDFFDLLRRPEEGENENILVKKFSHEFFHLCAQPNITNGHVRPNFSVKDEGVAHIYQCVMTCSLSDPEGKRYILTQGSERPSFEETAKSVKRVMRMIEEALKAIHDEFIKYPEETYSKSTFITSVIQAHQAFLKTPEKVRDLSEQVILYHYVRACLMDDVIQQKYGKTYLDMSVEEEQRINMQDIDVTPEIVMIRLQQHHNLTQ
jgi:hypothetical protein